MSRDRVVAPDGDRRLKVRRCVLRQWRPDVPEFADERVLVALIQVVSLKVAEGRDE